MLYDTVDYELMTVCIRAMNAMNVLGKCLFSVCNLSLNKICLQHYINLSALMQMVNLFSSQKYNMYIMTQCVYIRGTQIFLYFV